MEITAVSFLELLVLGTVAGFAGTLAGVGGGLVMMPVMILIFDIDTKIAIPASLLAIIASSTMVASKEIKEQKVNFNLGAFLETATIIGGVVGAILAFLVPSQVTIFSFAVLFLIFCYVVSAKHDDPIMTGTSPNPPTDYDGSVVDASTGKTLYYQPKTKPFGLLYSFGAGALSSFTGVGGGILNIPGMNFGMKVPWGAATCASILMTGVTIVTGIFYFFSHGMIHSYLAAPLVVGIIVGTHFAIKAEKKVSRKVVQKLFIIYALVSAVLLASKAGGILP